MDRPKHAGRRTFLRRTAALTTAALGVSLAGCTGSSDQSDDGGGDGGGSSDTIDHKVRNFSHASVSIDDGEYTENDDGERVYHLHGTLTNNTDDRLTSVDVLAKFYTEEGGDLLDSDNDIDTHPQIDAGESIEFTAVCANDVDSVGFAKLEVV